MTGTQGGAEPLHDRLAGLFEQARDALDGVEPSGGTPGTAALPGLVRGQELAAVRLWVAAMIPALTGHDRGSAAHG